MSELEIRGIEIIQTETQRGKSSRARIGSRTECPIIVGQCQKSDRCVIRVPDGEKMNKADKIFEKIEARIFPKINEMQ